MLYMINALRVMHLYLRGAEVYGEAEQSSLMKVYIVGEITTCAHCVAWLVSILGMYGGL